MAVGRSGEPRTAAARGSRCSPRPLSAGDVTALEQLEELRRTAQSLGIEVAAVEANRKQACDEACGAT